MIRTEPATEESVKNFEYDGIEKEMLDKINWRGQLDAYCKAGRAWQVMNESTNPIMLWGLFECSPGVLQGWMLFNRAAAFYAKSIAADIHERLRKELRTYHRIQTFVFAGEKSARYIELMGLKYEAKLECFGPNKEDALIYAMVKR